MIKNPILPGFHPDPSICRVGDDFYMVTSSFSFYPGIPIFHSRDLANWEQLGYVLDRPEQLPSGYEMLSGGIFAPTIRYHQGTYYVITTNMTMGFANFVVTANDPRGPWSDLHVIEGAVGIDPSLFFDEDGRAYYTGTIREEEDSGNGQAIWGCEIDLKEMRLLGERRILWRGAMVNAFAPEGPHIYKKDGWYYLMIAEGGTEHYHAVTISRSHEVLGSYEGFPGNPILTHRHLGMNCPIWNVGHGDLVELPDGSWYMAVLGSRLLGKGHKILGRETFLLPVEWENGWPVASPGTGRVEWEYPRPACLAWHPFPKGALPVETDTDFSDGSLGLEWNEIGRPLEAFYRLEDGCLKLSLMENELVPWELDGLSADVFQRIPYMKGGKKAGFLGRRQQHPFFCAKTRLLLTPEKGEAAGLVILQNDANQIRLEYRLDEEGREEAACIVTRTVIRDGRQYFEETVQGRLPMKAGEGGLGICVLGRETEYSFYACGPDDEAYRPVAEGVDGSFLGAETCGGYIGAYVGVFAFGDGRKDRQAAFTRFSYREMERSEG